MTDDISPLLLDFGLQGAAPWQTEPERKSESRGNVGVVGSMTKSHVFPALPLTEISAVTQAQRSATVSVITARISLIC